MPNGTEHDPDAVIVDTGYPTWASNNALTYDAALVRELRAAAEAVLADMDPDSAPAAYGRLDAAVSAFNEPATVVLQRHVPDE